MAAALDPASPVPASVPPEVADTHRPADRYGWLAGTGARLRYACWNASGTARATVIVLGGRGEFIEKYATEAMGELLLRGFAVMSLDWRGQGLSDRPLPDRHEAGHIDRFETYIADLRLFIDTIVGPNTQGPVIVLCHSMGGHIALRYLAEQGGPFTAAVVCSPMMALPREGVLNTALTLVPGTFDTRDLYGTPPFSWVAGDGKANNVTHDARRFHWNAAWFEADPRLSLGGPTLGWARQAVRSMHLTRLSGYLERIALPALMFSAGQDTVVDPTVHMTVAMRMKHCRLVTFDTAMHEIMMETDDIRARFWTEFDGFIAPLLS
ncbi:MAG: alpha/beta hydrolase [Reyranella sp.]|uniref:alpha/beta fold hydrolase n=1 Tax=Reyranella sp. TaxID=1929291 RepID=UPI001AD3FA5D|nr:alpha/beta hydrolase [Reyranella sp.]MBN9090822.1 alpha/beta hydrolase [Reyranella sp.]